MTAKMPSTKPNIMITARLLLMPVLQVGGVEGRALREGGQDVEREQGRDGEQGAQTRPDFFRNE